jgi:hypothetical protein
MEMQVVKMSRNKSREKTSPLGFLDDLAARYYQLAAEAEDPIEVEVARRQLAALKQLLNRQAVCGQRLATGYTSPNTPSKSKWANIPLTEIFQLAGNRLYPRSNGTVDCGHEPCHGSKSGRCVVIDPGSGRWYCRSCRRGGGVIAAVQSLFGLNYQEAAQWLSERYGVPVNHRVVLPADTPYAIREAWYKAVEHRRKEWKAKKYLLTI